MRLIILLLATTILSCVEVPNWVLAGILAQESRSYYTETGIVYVDKRTGDAGELSAFQITKSAWKQVRREGEVFYDLATDQQYAEDIATRYLIWLYKGAAKRSWPHAIQMYNAGPGRLSYRYYANVVMKARKAGYEVPRS